METVAILAAVAALLWLALVWLSGWAFDTIRVRIPNETDERLPGVLAEMRKRGGPVLRGHWVPEEQLWQLVEGSHRTTSAVRLGIGIELHELPPGSTVGNTDTGHPVAIFDGEEWREAPPDTPLDFLMCGPIYELPARKCKLVRWRPAKSPLQVFSLQFWKTRGVQ